MNCYRTLSTSVKTVNTFTSVLQCVTRLTLFDHLFLSKETPENHSIQLQAWN